MRPPQVSADGASDATRDAARIIVTRVAGVLTDDGRSRSSRRPSQVLYTATRLGIFDALADGSPKLARSLDA
jgi:hypothetical protein